MIREDRLRIIDHLIAGPQNYYGKELYVMLCNRVDDQFDYTVDDYGSTQMPVSLRQFRGDIEDLRQLASRDGVNLDYLKKSKIFRYSKEDYSVFGETLMSEDEINQLTVALSILNNIEGINSNKILSDLKERIASKVKIKTKELNDIVFLDQNEDLQGIQHLNSILQSIIRKKVIEIKYKPFEQEPINIFVHPYWIKQYNNRWYLFGLNNDAEEIHNYPLDRIQKIHETPILFKENLKADPNTWFKNIIGVSKYKNNPIQKIRLRINKPRAYYVITKPLHSSQKVISKQENYIEFEIKVRYNKELQALIDSFGKDCIWLNKKVPETNNKN